MLMEIFSKNRIGGGALEKDAEEGGTEKIFNQEFNLEAAIENRRRAIERLNQVEFDSDVATFKIPKMR